MDDEAEGELGSVLGGMAVAGWEALCWVALLAERLLWLCDCCIVLQALRDSNVDTANNSVQRLSINAMATSIASPSMSPFSQTIAEV